MLPVFFASHTPNMSSRTSWVLYAFVVATAISGPAQV